MITDTSIDIILATYVALKLRRGLMAVTSPEL